MNKEETKKMLDEVQRFKEFCAEFDYELDDKRMIQEIIASKEEKSK